jgi:phenylacetic acid degradation operon negative regulatory protein
MLTSERVGRRVRWDLTPWGRRLLTEGAARIYAHGRTRPTWDGQWLVLVASVPEQQRAHRHRLRTRLAWAGLGSPAAGMWVSPDTGRIDEVREVLAETGPADAHVVTGEYHGALTASELAERAWDLGDLAARYAEFVGRFADLEPADDAGALAAQIGLVDAWRRFPFLDPGLPDALLPSPWVGHRAAEVFHGRHTAWAAGALRAAAAQGL